jgi:hypothetical protein
MFLPPPCFLPFSTMPRSFVPHHPPLIQCYQSLLGGSFTSLSTASSMQSFSIQLCTVVSSKILAYYSSTVFKSVVCRNLFTGAHEIKTVSLRTLILCLFHYVHICTKGANAMVGKTASLAPLSMESRQ